MTRTTHNRQLQQSQADLIHQYLGIPVTVYGFDGQEPIRSRGTTPEIDDIIRSNEESEDSR